MADPARFRSAEPGRDPRSGAALTDDVERRGARSAYSAGGFTLIEVLVALAIIAVALAAGFRSVAQSTESASALKARTLALWVAQNRLAAAQLEVPPPAVGERSGRETQAGAEFAWQQNVGGTPNPAFRRVEITVADATRPDYVLARLVGYIGGAAQP